MYCSPTGHPAIIIHAQRHDAVNRDVDVMVRFIVFIAQTAVQVYVYLQRCHDLRPPPVLLLTFAFA